MADHHQYSYMTADDMKLGEDSHRIDVTRDEENRGKFFFLDTFILFYFLFSAPSRMNESITAETYGETFSPRGGHLDNVNIKRAIHAG